jgi:hypothetical protein
MSRTSAVSMATSIDINDGNQRPAGPQSADDRV